MSNFNSYCLTSSLATVNESHFIIWLNVPGFSPNTEQNICATLLPFLLILDNLQHLYLVLDQYSCYRFLYLCYTCKVTSYCPQLRQPYIPFVTSPYYLHLLSEFQLTLTAITFSTCQWEERKNAWSWGSFQSLGSLFPIVLFVGFFFKLI